MRPNHISGIYPTELSHAGHDTPTELVAEVAWLIVNNGWLGITSRSRSSQLRKWLRFCDKDDRSPLQGTDLYVLELSLIHI